MRKLAFAAIVASGLAAGALGLAGPAAAQGPAIDPVIPGPSDDLSPSIATTFFYGGIL